jgi:hypothetical protein
MVGSDEDAAFIPSEFTGFYVRSSGFLEATHGTDRSAEFIPQQRSVVNDPAE